MLESAATGWKLIDCQLSDIVRTIFRARAMEYGSEVVKAFSLVAGVNTNTSRDVVLERHAFHPLFCQ